MLLGYFSPLWFPQCGDLRAGVLLWSPLLSIAFILVILVLGDISDRIVLKVFASSGNFAVQTLQMLLTFVVMLGC